MSSDQPQVPPTENQTETPPEAPQSEATPDPPAEPTASENTPESTSDAPAPTDTPKSESLRDRLKQAQKPEAAQAVPTAEPDKAQVDEVAYMQASKGPVAIPTEAEEDIDAMMEAEIEAALASGEIGDSPAPVETTTDGESETAQSEDEEVPPENEEQLEAGIKLSATIQSLDDENVFLDLGYRSPGLLSKRQFSPKQDPPKAGDKLTVRVDRYDAVEGIIFVSLPSGRKKVGGDFTEVNVGQIVDCVVNKTNKGGLEVAVGSLRGFMPAGQVDIAYQADLEQFVGQKLQASVIEVNPQKKRLVVSRRAFLEIERRENAETLWNKLEVGAIKAGTVKTIKDYGAFIDIGGMDGFLHIGEISHLHIKHPKDVLKEGQNIEVKIVSLEPEKSRIGLSYKALQKDPWMVAAETYGVGTSITGPVTRTTKFGAFVELEPGIEGLVHISELNHKRVGRVTEVVREGQQVTAQILSVDPNSRRISLSLKALTTAPEPVRDEDRAPSAGEEYQRKRKGPLKGGTGGDSAGGLFGDPNKFD